MGYCNAEELHTFFTTADDRQLNQFAQQVFPYTNNRPPFVQNNGGYYEDAYSIVPSLVTMESVQVFLDEYHEMLSGGSFIAWKGFRPWVVVDLTSRLDPDKAWIGWEVETGWNSSEARDRVISTFFDEYEHVCIDSEGGSYGVEFTWTPKEVGTYEEAQHPLMFIPRFNRSTETHSPRDQIGTHINVSTPTQRKMDYTDVQAVSSAMNQMLMTLNYEQKERLFGRGSLYGGFYVRGSHSSGSAKQELWLEGKLFNSTYNVPVARGYIAVGDRIAVLVEAIASAIAAVERTDTFKYASATIENGYAFLNGKDEQPIITTVQSLAKMVIGFDDDPDEDIDDDWDEDEEGTWCESCGCHH